MDDLMMSRSAHKTPGSPYTQDCGSCQTQGDLGDPPPIQDEQEQGILPSSVSPPVHPPLESPPKESIPPTIDANSESVMFQISTPRIFLDLCSGVSSPLSQALQRFGCDTLAFDILIHQDYDLLRDDAYERLLRLCTCGLLAYAAAAPACKEYSRLKLRSGGPKALRTPIHLQGVPGLTSAEGPRIIHNFRALRYV